MKKKKIEMRKSKIILLSFLGSSLGGNVGNPRITEGITFPRNKEKLCCVANIPVIVKLSLC